MRTRLFVNLGLLAGLVLSLLSPAKAEVVLGTQDTFYPRLIRLAANGTANGRLLASFDIAGTKGLINESVDGGLSWAEVGNVNTGADPAHCCSTLYEVPQTLGTTAQGTLLWATTTINGSAYNIRIHKSIDKGRSWSFLATAVSGAVAACAAVAAFALPFKLNIVVAIAAAVAMGLLINHTRPRAPLPLEDRT